MYLNTASQPGQCWNITSRKFVATDLVKILVNPHCTVITKLFNIKCTHGISTQNYQGSLISKVRHHHDQHDQTDQQYLTKLPDLIQVLSPLTPALHFTLLHRKLGNHNNYLAGPPSLVPY
jgi:hypothetical protein